MAVPPTAPGRGHAEVPEFFGGLPAWLLIGGLAIAALAALGLRTRWRLARVLTGGSQPCTLGAEGGVPNLREA